MYNNCQSDSSCEISTDVRQRGWRAGVLPQPQEPWEQESDQQSTRIPTGQHLLLPKPSSTIFGKTAEECRKTVVRTLGSLFLRTLLKVRKY